MSKVKRLASPQTEADIHIELNESFTQLLRARRKAEIEAFLVALRDEALADAVAKDGEALASVLDLAIGDYGVSQKELALHLGVSVAAVGRWRSNDNTPRSYARKAILTSLDALISRQLVAEYSSFSPGELQPA